MDIIYIGTIILLVFLILFNINKNKKITNRYEELINSSSNEITATLIETEKKYERQLQTESKEIHEQHNRKLENIKNTVIIQYKKDFQKIKEDHKEKLNKLEDYIKNLEKYSRNRGEVITHKILVDLKRILVKNQHIKNEDMIIMGNVFIPFIEKSEMKTRQIDHLILSQSGILIIETKYWKGKILHGISKKNNGGMSIVVNNMFYDNVEDKEETIIFEPIKKNDDNIREFKVTSYDNPVTQVRKTAGKLNEYISQKLNINRGIGSLVYYAYPTDEKNFVKNYSLKTSEKDKYATLICNESNDLRTSIFNLVTRNEKKYSLDELKKIEMLLNEFNRIV